MNESRSPINSQDAVADESVASPKKPELEKKTLSVEKQDELIKLMKKRYERGIEFDEHDRKEALEDLEFGILVKQWDETVKREREADGRPCLVINKLPEMVDQIVGSIRSSDASIKVRPKGDNSDKKIAEINQGLINAIMGEGDASIASDEAAESAVWCGRGFYRVLTRYADEDTFDQEIFIEPIKERFTVVLDPGAQRYDKTDGKWLFVEDTIPKEDFEDEYGKIDPVEWDSQMQEADGWFSEEEIRIVEYFWKKEEKSKLYLLSDGSTTDERPEDKGAIERERDVVSYKVMWVKATGDRILDGPRQVPGEFIPIVPVWGKEATINKKRYTRGAIRYAKDPQRIYNYFRSTEVETVALQPKAPYMVTAKQLQGFEKFWDVAHKKLLPYLPYNADPASPGKPQREAPPTVPSGFAQEAMVSDSEIRSTVGLHAPSLGQPDAHKSGKAIKLLQNRGDLGSFAFIDNVNLRSMKHCGRIIMSMIPYIYDTERLIRIKNRDGSASTVRINSQPQQPGEEVIDLTNGKYDVVVDTGPGYLTQRQESMDFWLSLAQSIPKVAEILGDIIVRNADVKDADEAEKRLRKMLPPGMAEPREGEQPPPQNQGPSEIDQIKTKKEAAELAKTEWEIQNLREKHGELKAQAEKARLETVLFARDNELTDVVRPDPPPQMNGPPAVGQPSPGNAAMMPGPGGENNGY